MTAPIAAATPKAESRAGPEDAITGPIRAVATNPPVRATALFSPDAAPVWRLSTDIRTAVVDGATAQAIPEGNHEDRGKPPKPVACGRSDPQHQEKAGRDDDRSSDQQPSWTYP